MGRSSYMKHEYFFPQPNRLYLIVDVIPKGGVAGLVPAKPSFDRRTTKT